MTDNLCEWVLNNQDKNILFTDEATFTKLGICNVHNEHWWAHDNTCGTTGLIPGSFQRKFWVLISYVLILLRDNWITSCTYAFCKMLLMTCYSKCR